MLVTTVDQEGARHAPRAEKVGRSPLALEQTRLAGTPSDERFDRIVRLTRRVLDVPIARIDMAAEQGAAAWPVVPFHQSVALRLHGRPVGTLHVGDFSPRVFDDAQKEMLRQLAGLAEQQIGEAVMQLHLAEENEFLRRRASVDTLTSIWNRGAILEIAEREIEAAASRDQTVGIAIVDLDFFKAINDRMGHAAGDAVLREIAARLRTEMRATDAVGRYGGEEFLVVMPAATLAMSVAAAERIRQALARPIEFDGVTISVTASFGVAVHGREVGTLDETIRAADEALYRAKGNGRNRVVVAASERPRISS